jgi:hypothetical protein
VSAAAVAKSNSKKRANIERQRDFLRARADRRGDVVL